ncbi:ADP-ribosyltransferase, partial [Pantoea endophytica]
EQSRLDIDRFFKDNIHLKELKITYRGLKGFNPYENKKEGEIVSDKAYLSTSASEEIAQGFTSPKVCSTLVIVKGWSGIDISSFSNKKHEKEVLYPRNTKFKINYNSPNRVSIEEVSDIKDKKSDIRMVALSKCTL